MAPTTATVGPYSQAQQLTTTTGLGTALAAVTPPPFTTPASYGPNDICVDPRETFQQVLGAGMALTDAAAYNLMNLSSSARAALLAEIFSPTANNVSMLRVSFGSTDFQQSSPYTYNEVPTGATDASLLNFSIQNDTLRLIPILRQILAINPGIKIFASIWHPPSWMVGVPADNFTATAMTFVGTWATTYANYIVKCIQAYLAMGVPIYAVNYANECEPGSKFGITVTDQKAIIAALGPALETAGLDTLLLSHDGAWDTWADRSTVASQVLADATALSYTKGISFHGYIGKPQMMAKVLRTYPHLKVFCTEWRALAAESDDTQMRGMAGGWITEALQYGSSGSMIWNLALDENGGPQDGFHPGRLPGVTINSSTGAITRTTQFYAVAHLTKWLQPGALRCLSAGPARGTAYEAYLTYPSTLKHVAMVNPDGSVLLYVYNGTGASVSFQIVDARSDTAFPVTMVAGQLSTFTWGTPATAVPVGTALALTAQAVTPIATTAPGGVTLSWSAPSGAPVTGYRILRGATQVGMADAGATSYSEYVTGGSYQYTVVTETTVGTASSSAVAATVASATAPSAPVLSTVSGGTLSWTASSANGSALSYAVKRATSSGGTYTTLTTLAAGYLTYDDVTAENGTTYYYVVAATNSTGTTASNEVSVVRNGPRLDAISTGTPNTSGQLSFTWSHTVGALSNRILLVSVGFSGGGAPETDSALASVTYGGASLTKLTSVAADPALSSNRMLEFWYLIAPTTGTANIVATLTNVTGSKSAFFYPGAISFSGVDQVTPFRTAVTSSSTASASASLTTTSGASDDIVVAAITARTTATTLTIGATQVRQWQINKGDNTQNCLTTQNGGSGSIVSTFSWPSSDREAAIAVAVRRG